MNHNDERDFLEELANEADIRREQEAELAALSIRDRIPEDWPVQPAPYVRLEDIDVTGRTQPTGYTQCGTCGLIWDDGVSTTITPTPSGRCPFEPFHEDPDEDDDEGLLPGDEEPRTFAILALHADVVREDAQWSGYDDESEGATDRERIVRLEGMVERLAAQVSELALRLAQEGGR